MAHCLDKRGCVRQMCHQGVTERLIFCVQFKSDPNYLPAYVTREHWHKFGLKHTGSMP